jgi:MFS family permease
MSATTTEPAATAEPAATVSADTTTAERGARGDWPVFAAVFAASVAAAAAQFAVPPVMPLLMGEFATDLTQASLLVSVFSVTGVVLALPAGVILARFGAWSTGLVAVGSVAVGSIAGVVAPDYGVLIASRAVQGIGVGLIGIVAPAVVSTVFPPSRRGVPMGLWATWMPVGGLLMFNLGPRLGIALGWQVVWWLGAAMALVAFALYAVLLRGVLPGTTSGSGGELRAGVVRSLRIPSVWALGAAFALAGISLGALTTFLPTYLVEEHGYDLGSAASLSSLVLLTLVIGAPVAGAVSDRLGSRKLVYTVPAVVIAAMWPFVFGVDPAILSVMLLAAGLGIGAIATGIFSSASEVVPDPALIPMALGVVMLGQNVAAVVGPMVFSAAVGATGWSTAGVLMGVIGLAGAAVGWMARVR